MRVDVATPEEVHEVALNMRMSDWNEFRAVTPTSTREELAELLRQRYGGRSDVLCAKWGDVPAAIGGALELRPNVLTLLFFAAPEFGYIGKELTRFIKQRLFPPLVSAGVHRIEAVSMEGHQAAHRWIGALGLTQEGPPLRGYGKRGQSFIQFSWVK